MKLSIVIPVYNEAATISRILDRVRSVDVGMDKEILLSMIVQRMARATFFVNWAKMRRI